MSSPGNPNVAPVGQFRGPPPQQQRPQGPANQVPGQVRHTGLPGMDQMQNRYPTARPVGNSMPPVANPMIMQQHPVQPAQPQQQPNVQQAPSGIDSNFW
jgi:hypothetical protein